MTDDGIIIKGNKDGLNVVINLNRYRDFTEMLDDLVEKLSKGKRFYEGADIKIIMDLSNANDKDIDNLKAILYKDFKMVDCILENKEDETSKVFNGLNEGKTRFLRRTIRSGQSINYNGNIVIIGDINPGSEVSANGNVIVLGTVKGKVYAGLGGNDKAIIAAFSLQPEIIKIADIVSRAPEDSVKPEYPEVARVKDNGIIVEPYILNKFL